MHRTISIPIALFAVLAVLQATCAYGAFIRADVATIVGDCEKANWVAFAQSPSSSDLDAGAAAPKPYPPEPDDQPAPHEFVPAAPASGATSAPTASTTHGPGSAPAACATTIPPAPQLLLAGRLPDEMGPRFSNPPPRNPFRPPRELA